MTGVEDRAEAPPAQFSGNDLDQLYTRRFDGEAEFRDEMWRILCARFFQRWVPPDAVVLDVAAGGCEFINAVTADKRIAVDANPAVKQAAATGVQAVVARSDDMAEIASASVDVAFASNFFEHLTRPQILATLTEILRVLRPGGRLLILQPNIRYCARDYWMFFDHITPLDHHSVTEALELSGYEVVHVLPRFLPFTTKSRLPKSTGLVRAYLAVPLLWRVMGQQSFLVAAKPSGPAVAGPAHHSERAFPA